MSAMAVKPIPVFFHEIRLCERLGQGAYGRVNRGEWNCDSVAVKEFEDDDWDTYETELEQLSMVNHPNIIQLLAFARDTNMKFLVMEYADRGSLYKVLHGNKKQDPAKQISYHSGHAMSWCLQCASGVEYLHSAKPHKIIHRDLKSPNLLLFSDGLVLKICDFGTACNKRTIMTNNKGSAPWMAPEVFSGNNYTEKCDVFSFAIIMWEIFTRQLPFHDSCDNAQQIQWAKYRGRRPQRINKIPDDLWRLMDKCWANSVTSRPSMTEVVEVLTLMKPCFPDADNEPLIFPEDDADSSIYISARTSQTSATRDNSSQEVDGAGAGGSYYPQGGGLQSYTGDMTTAKFNPSPNGVPPNSVMFNNFMSTSSVQTNSHPTPTAVLQPPMGFFQDLRREQGSAAMGDSPVGAAYGHQRFGTPMEDPNTEIPRLPALSPEMLRDAPPGLIRNTSLHDYITMCGMTPDWPPPPPPPQHQPDAYYPHHPHLYPPYGAPYMSPYLGHPSAPKSQASPSVDRLHQGLEGMHLEGGGKGVNSSLTPPQRAADRRGHSPIAPPFTHNFHSFPNIVGNTYHPPSDSGMAPGWMGNPANAGASDGEAAEARGGTAVTPTPKEEQESEAAAVGATASVAPAVNSSNEAARAPFCWLNGNFGYPSYAGLSQQPQSSFPNPADRNKGVNKRQPNPGIHMFLPRVPARLSPYANSPYNVSQRSSQEIPIMDKPQNISGQSSFKKGHRRSCSDGSSGELASLGWQHQHGNQWRRSYSNLAMAAGPYEEGYHVPPMQPHLQHPDYPYDTLDSALDRDIRDLISPELQPIAPQPNCPQSMRIYQDSRMMAGALLNVRMETNQLQMQKAVLENKLNQTDAEFAMAMAEANDESFPFNKEQVEKYYDLKAKEAALIQYKEQLTEQYQQKMKQQQGKETSPAPSATAGPTTPRQSRNPIKRLMRQKVPVPDPVDLQSMSVEGGNWELVDKSPSPVAEHPTHEEGPREEGQ